LQTESQLSLRRLTEFGFVSAVSKAGSFIKYWLPVLIWMAVIFVASSDSGSFRRSSRIIEPLLRWLFPHIAQPTVNLIVFIARKCAHLTEYAVLGMLVWRALRKLQSSGSRPWSWSTAGWTVLLVAFYASSDEFHQRFVPSRDASVRDVMIDTGGAGAGILLLWAVGRWRKWWINIVPNPAGTGGTAKPKSDDRSPQDIRNADPE